MPRLLAVLTLALLASPPQPHPAIAQGAATVRLPFEEVLTAFKHELEIAQARAEPFCPLLIEQALVTFVTSAGATTDTTVGGSFTVLGLAVGADIAGRRGESSTNTVAIELRPPGGAGAERPISAAPQMGLAALISDVRRGIEAAARRPPPLAVASVKISYSFELRQKQGGGLEFVVLKGGASNETGASHKIDMTLKPVEGARCG